MMDWIIVIDDDISHLKLAGTILSRHNMRVTALRSGRVALDYIRQNGFPDLILLDMNMPEMDGFETLEKLSSEMPLNRKVPVIFLTAEEGHLEEVRALEAGAADFIRKPYEPEVLVSRIRRLLDRLGESSARTSPGEAPDFTLETITALLSEQSNVPNTLWMGRDFFGSFYKYMVRYMDRYHSSAYQVLLTLLVPADKKTEARAAITAAFRKTVCSALRSSDVMMECKDNQQFLLLPEVQDYDIERVMTRLRSAWRQNELAEGTELSFECEKINGTQRVARESRQDGVHHVVVVDDDKSNLLLAEGILAKQQLKVTTLSSGQALLNLLRRQMPDLILLDMKMPHLDGVDTFRLVRKEYEETTPPVIFLTADESEGLEAKCLDLGAMDFIKKPILPDVLVLRVRHTLELIDLQNHLAELVSRKTEENENLSLHVVQTLAEAIDAKDRYTNGHSSRVAAYARDIGRRYGYTIKQQEDLYMMGLLHDVGKIGVPDAVINKPGKLTEEEFALVKEHPVMGARILEKIKEMPKLSIGARWHHERYDGTGYPDGLQGTDILEEARIIAVADAYDAMTSRRSYRDILTQDAVRQEIIDGSGTQFDPVFAGIMLQMMDDDPEYRMREF